MFDQVETEIIESLKFHSNNKNETKQYQDRIWTSEIKESICAIGHNLGYLVSSAGCKGSDTGEWLFDLVWVQGSGDVWNFSDIILAMECEWSIDQGDLEWDFEKLLVVKSNYKLFVFNRNTTSEIEDSMKRFKDMVTYFKKIIPGERYLFAGYSRESNEFIFSAVKPE